MLTLSALFITVSVWAQSGSLKVEIDHLAQYPLNVTTIQNLYDYYIGLESIYLKHRVVNELQHEADVDDEYDKKRAQMKAKFEQTNEEFEGLSDDEIVAKALRLKNQGTGIKVDMTGMDPAKMEQWHKMVTEYNSHIEPTKNKLHSEVAKFENLINNSYHNVIGDYHKAITDAMGIDNPQDDIIIENEYKKMMPELNIHYNNYYLKDSLFIKSAQKYESYLIQTYLPFMKEYTAISKDVLPFLTQGVANIDKEVPKLDDIYREALLEMLDLRIFATEYLIRYCAYKYKTGIFYLVFPTSYANTDENDFHPSIFIFYDVPKIINNPNGDENTPQSKPKNEKTEKVKKLIKSLF